MSCFKMICWSLTVAVISVFIAVQYYPQGGSRICLTVNQVKSSLAKFRNVTHRFPELFCNNSDECKQAADEFFGILSDIHQDVVRLMEFVGDVTFAHKESHDHDHGEEEETWKKMNTEPVCFGTRDNQYGTFRIQKGGRLKTIKLIYKWGGVICSGDYSATYWGCRHQKYGDNGLLTVITDANKNIVMPPVENLKKSGEPCDSKKDFYSLDGTTHSSPELVFPDLSIPLSVSRNQELQIWYSQDLVDCTEDNNSGKTCVDVYGWYA